MFQIWFRMNFIFRENPFSSAMSPYFTEPCAELHTNFMHALCVHSCNSAGCFCASFPDVMVIAKLLLIIVKLLQYLFIKVVDLFPCLFIDKTSFMYYFVLIYFQIRRRRLARLDRSPRTDPTTSPSQEARTPTKAAAPVSPTQAAASPVRVPRLSLETDSAGQSGKPAQEPRWSSHGPWAFKRPPRTLVSTPRRGSHEDVYFHFTLAML